jgi:hypothetical protein
VLSEQSKRGTKREQAVEPERFAEARESWFMQKFGCDFFHGALGIAMTAMGMGLLDSDYTVLTTRNEIAAAKILMSETRKIVVHYGEAHVPGLVTYLIAKGFSLDKLDKIRAY